ncbi:MAG TPA: ferredoxin, partial [Paraprevotella xylaniphila]|nr:ferredoxin [Paraprevotella xylaniphila]
AAPKPTDPAAQPVSAPAAQPVTTVTSEEKKEA